MTDLYLEIYTELRSMLYYIIDIPGTKSVFSNYVVIMFLIIFLLHMMG